MKPIFSIVNQRFATEEIVVETVQVRNDVVLKLQCESGISEEVSEFVKAYGRFLTGEITVRHLIVDPIQATGLAQKIDLIRLDFLQSKRLANISYRNYESDSDIESEFNSIVDKFVRTICN